MDPTTPVPGDQRLREAMERFPGAYAVLLAGPSGVGKTTICRRVHEELPGIERCPTTTTRPPRSGETDGAERHFVTEEAFRHMREANEFLECALVHGHWYGARFDAVVHAMSLTGVILMDVDVQGVQTWKRVLQDRCVTVFVLPPSLEILASRLSGRNSEKPDAFQRRMANALQEMRRARSYDYLIVNDELSRATGDVKAIIRAEGNRTRRVEHRLSSLEQTVPPQDKPL